MTEKKISWPPSSSPLLYLFNLPVWPMGHVFAMLCTWQWERSNKFKLQMLQVEQRLMKELCLCVAWWQMWCVSKEGIQRSLFKDVVWLVSRKNSTCKGASLFKKKKKGVTSINSGIFSYIKKHYFDFKNIISKVFKALTWCKCYCNLGQKCIQVSCTCDKCELSGKDLGI